MHLLGFFNIIVYSSLRNGIFAIKRNQSNLQVRKMRFNHHRLSFVKIIIIC